MLDSMNLPDDFAKRCICFGTFPVKLQSLVYFAFGYKYTKSSKCGINFPQEFFIISLRIL